MDQAHEIESLMRAKYPILFITSWEERRVEACLSKISQNLKRKFFSWSLIQGSKPALAAGKTQLPPELEILAQVSEAEEYTVFLLKDFHPYLKDVRVIRLLRDLAQKLRGRAQTLVLMGPSFALPTELEKDITLIEFGLPNVEEIAVSLDRVIAAVADNPAVNTKLEPAERELLIKSAQGLTLDEIESVFARSLVQTKHLSVDAVLGEKQQIVRKSGLLEYYPADSRLKDVGGMALLKDWLEKRSKSFSDAARTFGIPVPKGILLLGVQGCGKSLCAKAVAASWNLPMLKLDVGRIFGGIVGQSEENIRKAISVAESLAPCVLWADELEKGFAGSSGSGVSDGGTTARVFATFLTWMQEKTKPVFLIATANDVSQLPPEMLRKGRFDEIFFVDLPGDDEREQIFRIHLEKRKRDPKLFQLTVLGAATEGYSGAEIEQIVVGGLYSAFDSGRELTQEDLLQEAKAVVPLSVMMAEDIDALRDWAKLRTRPAS